MTPEGIYAAPDGERATCAKVIEVLDGWHSRGLFQNTDALLAQLDPQRMTPAIILSTLSVSWHAKHMLGHWRAFLAKAEEALLDKLKDPARVDRLLARMR